MPVVILVSLLFLLLLDNPSSLPSLLLSLLPSLPPSSPSLPLLSLYLYPSFSVIFRTEPQALHVIGKRSVNKLYTQLSIYLVDLLF